LCAGGVGFLRHGGPPGVGWGIVQESAIGVKGNLRSYKDKMRGRDGGYQADCSETEGRESVGKRSLRGRRTIRIRLSRGEREYLFACVGAS